MKIGFRKLTAGGAVLSAALVASSAFASLIQINTVPSTGNGLGAVNTVVTFQNTGTEIGAVGPGPGGTEVTGSTMAFGIGGTVTPTHETGGNAGSNIYTTSGLGITSAGANTFANVILLFNANEGGGPNSMVTLQNLSLNLFSSTGTFLDSFTTTQAYTYDALQGIGNAGFGFQLDATQATEANNLLASNAGGLIIGAAARVSGADAGPETISISRINSTQPPVGTPGVPDSGITIILLGLSLMAMETVRRRFLS